MLAPLQDNTLDHFIAWLETYDPTRTFNFFCVQTCVLGQYDRAHGREPTASVARFDTLLDYGVTGLDVIIGPDTNQKSRDYCENIPIGDVLKRAKEARGW